MDRDELRSRFRLVLIAYVLFTAVAVAGAFINAHQQTEIEHTQDALVHDTKALARAIAEDQAVLCMLVKQTAPAVTCVPEEQRYQQILASLQSTN
jgi:hypothetical protein